MMILTFALYKGELVMGLVVCGALLLASFTVPMSNEPNICSFDLASQGEPLPSRCALCGLGPCEKKTAPTPAPLPGANQSDKEFAS